MKLKSRNHLSSSMGVSIYRHGYNIFNSHDKNLINFTKERSFLTVRSVQLPDKKTN